MNTSRIDQRLMQFAAQVLLRLEEFPKTFASRQIMEQLARSAMSIGANYEEATAAESRADFIHKMGIALKESRETCYWLGLAQAVRLVDSASLSAVVQEALQIRAMLTRAVFTAKANAATSEQR